MENDKIYIDSISAGLRIDKFLSEQDSNRTRSYIQKLIKENYITANGTCVKANYKLSEGDILEVRIPESIPLDIVPEDIPLDILFEDADLIVLNKPKNMVVHPAAGHYSGTIVNALLYHCKSNLSGINGIMRPGIVHRIDKDTTGAIVVCKNDLSHNSLALQL
ncbi:MAG: pseudouridine synthase, partial [Acetivibrio sp.]